MFLYEGLIILCVVFYSQAQHSGLAFSGSGMLPDDEDVVLIVSSGDATTTTTTTATITVKSTTQYLPRFSLTDDEDIAISGSGSGDVGIVLEGSGDTSELKVCAEGGLSCWCVDKLGRVIASTLTHLSVVSDSFPYDCDLVEQSLHLLGGVGKLSTSRPNTPGSSTPVTRPSTPSTPTALPTRRTTPRRLHNSPPHVVTNGRTKRPPIHHEKPERGNKPSGGKETFNFNEPREGVDHDGVFREPVDTVGKHSLLSMLSHPGILAAVIGGAVVALLCTLLLVMFIVYRMKKKDEGSYAVDPTVKPPVNSYTEEPNKEVYA